MIIPKVLVTERPSMLVKAPDLGENVFIFSEGAGKNLPNLKEYKVYYLKSFGEKRIFHIQKYEKIEDELVIKVGNSFIYPDDIEVVRHTQVGYYYTPLTTFRLQQIAPGNCLLIQREMLEGETNNG